MRCIRIVQAVLVVLGLVAVGPTPNLISEEIVLRAMVIPKPIAVLLEIKGEGQLTRDGKTYTVNAAGVGFKKNDVFTVPPSPTGDHYAVISLNKASDPEHTSYVRLEEGAKIVFLDDDGKVAITGVYAESTQSVASSMVFYINHATPESPFFIWTPDVVIAVRGTYFEVKPADVQVTYPTKVVAYNTANNEEINQNYVGAGKFDPDDLRIIPANKIEFLKLLKIKYNKATDTIPNVVKGGNILVKNIDLKKSDHMVSMIVRLMKDYKGQLKEQIKGKLNKLSNLGIFLSNKGTEEITYQQPEDFVEGILPKFFSSLGESPARVDFDFQWNPLKPLTPPKLTIIVTYLITDNTACFSVGSTCKYKVYEINSTVSLYDVLVHNWNLTKKSFKNFVIGLVENYNLLWISAVGNQIQVSGCTCDICPNTGRLLGNCKGPTCPGETWAVSIFEKRLKEINVKWRFAIDNKANYKYFDVVGSNGVFFVRKPGYWVFLRIERDNNGKFVYPVLKVEKASPVPGDKKVNELKLTKINYEKKIGRERAEWTMKP